MIQNTIFYINSIKELQLQSLKIKDLVYKEIKNNIPPFTTTYIGILIGKNYSDTARLLKLRKFTDAQLIAILKAM